MITTFSPLEKSYVSLVWRLRETSRRSILVGQSKYDTLCGLAPSVINSVCLVDVYFGPSLQNEDMPRRLPRLQVVYN
jgi:hypothetical protein